MKKPLAFGKYLLLERINVGGMAEVFIAKALGVEGFERIVAIKRILPTLAEDREFITMFIDEARISIQLSHSNIVYIHEMGKHQGAYYLAMEYVPSKDLRVILEWYRRRKEPMPVAQAVYIASRMCEGLDYAHRKKDINGKDLHIIHRDVSPQNVLLSYEGEVKIIDFGIAKAANRSQRTQAGILKGKFGYMSPEQVRGLPVDHRSDIFALGVVLYEMLSGEKLFTGSSDYSILEKVRQADIPSIRKFNARIPAALEKVLLKALARDQSARYQWASDFHQDLLRYLQADDEIYSAKQLSRFLSEAFRDDIKKETKKLAGFASVTADTESVPALPRMKDDDVPDDMATQIFEAGPLLPGLDEPHEERTILLTTIPPSVGVSSEVEMTYVPPPGVDLTPVRRPSMIEVPRSQVVIGNAKGFQGETLIGRYPASARSFDETDPMLGKDSERLEGDHERTRTTAELPAEPSDVVSESPPVQAPEKNRHAYSRPKLLVMVSALGVFTAGVLAILVAHRANRPATSTERVVHRTAAQAPKIEKVSEPRVDEVIPALTPAPKAVPLAQAEVPPVSSPLGNSHRANRPRKFREREHTHRHENVQEPTPNKTPLPIAVAPTKDTGLLACSSQPIGAEVWVDGKRSGRETPVGTGNALTLSAGNHTVVFKLGDKQSKPQTVVIPAGQMVKLVRVTVP